jgi:hypothetical protein
MFHAFPYASTVADWRECVKYKLYGVLSHRVVHVDLWYARKQWTGKTAGGAYISLVCMRPPFGIDGRKRFEAATWESNVAATPTDQALPAH